MNEGNSDKKAHFRKEIVLKARNIVSKMGFKKSSIEKIAKALDRTKGALYHYFENKEDLFKAVLRYEEAELLKALTEAVNAETDPARKLYVFFMTRAKKIYELWTFYQFVIEEYFKRYSFIINSLTESGDNEIITVRAILQEGIDQNIFDVSDPTITSKAFVKSLRGYDFLLFQGEPFEDIEDEISVTIQIFIKGISK